MPSWLLWGKVGWLSTMVFIGTQTKGQEMTQWRWKQKRKVIQRPLASWCYHEHSQSIITAYNYWLWNIFLHFSYPVVYIICILPNMLSWSPIFHNGFKAPYQFTLFASTLFSFSGTFSAVLFFLTQPGLAVGLLTSQTHSQIQSDHCHEKSKSMQGPNYIPTRRPAASDYITPDLGRSDAPLNIEETRR